MDRVIIRWKGKAVGKNQKLLHGRGNKGFCVNPKYKEFKNNISNIIKEQYPDTKFEGEVDIELIMSVGSQRDHHNLIQPILDAVQQSGIITNDRLVCDLFLPKPKRHKNKQPDIILIVIDKHDNSKCKFCEYCIKDECIIYSACMEVLNV